MSIIENLNTVVQRKAQDKERFYATQSKPNACPHCDHKTLHFHGEYPRNLCTESETIRILIPRFLCTSCRRTFSILPESIGRHQRITWNVQQRVYQIHDEQGTLETAATSVSAPTGPLSIRTVSRWKKRWREWLRRFENSFWSVVLAVKPTLSLPKGHDRPESIFRWLKEVWAKVCKDFNDICLFQMMYHLRQPNST